MINPKDIDLINPDSVKNLPKEFIDEISDGRDPSEIAADPKKKGAVNNGSNTKVH